MENFPHWWETYPERLEQEAAALQALGISFEEDPAAKAEGIIRWTFTAPDTISGHGDVRLEAAFPEFYPYVRPDVVAPEMMMGHHQQPFGKNLCLIGRASEAWNTSDTLAWLIEHQLPKALAAGTSEGPDEGEEDQGEPFSDYYSVFHRTSMVLIDSAWDIPDHPAGGLASVTVAGPVPLEDDARTLFTIQHLALDDGRSVATMAEQVQELYGRLPVWKARWSTVAAEIQADDAEAIWLAAEYADRKFSDGIKIKGVDYQLRLVAFPEEHSRSGTGTGWLLVLKRCGEMIKPKGKDLRSGNPAKRSPQQSPSQYQLIRAGRIGPTDLRARTTHLAGLTAKNVLLLGAGALGSVIAEKLARAGLGQLTVIDQDVLEPGNLARHACNIAQVGTTKAGAVCSLVRHVNPYTKVKGHAFRIGSAIGGSRILAEEYADCDLIIDATAEVGVQRLTADLAARTGKAWIAAEATNGARGGTIVHVPSDGDWCFSCFEWHRGGDPQLHAPAGPSPLTQPAGCAEPTFTGAAHDLEEVALQAVRTAVAVLRGGTVHDAVILTIQDSAGRDLPSWQGHQVTKHAECLHA